jgi:hydroxyacylglutathione hydrolase
VEPNNEKLKSKLKWTIQQLNNQRSTVPSTIGEELEYNPFLRVEEEEIKVSTGKNSPIEVLGELREMKNNFK